MGNASDNSATSPAIAAAGVVLSFDDYSETWVKHLPLLQSFGIRATFFVAGDFLRDTVKAQARLRPLVDAGHSLGVHTFSHRRATVMWADEGQAWLDIDVIDQARVLAEVSGQRVRAFAYPYGDHDNVTDQVLMPHFHIVRAFGKKIVFTTRQKLRAGGVIYATSIDNGQGHDSAWHRTQLANVTRQSEVWVVASHHIDESKWGITPERLTQFAESARQLSIQFYRFEDFME